MNKSAKIGLGFALWKLFKNDEEMYRIKTENGEMVVSPEQRVYVRYLDSYSLTSNPPSVTLNNLPLNSFTSDKSKDKAATSFSALGGCITNTIMPEYSLGGNKEVLRKSESREIIVVFSSFAKEANLPLEIPLDVYSALNPLEISNVLIDLGIFSSRMNFEFNIMFSPHKHGSIIQSSTNHFSSQARIFFNELLYTFSGSDQFNNIAYQNSCAFEGWLATTNLAICNNIFIDINSHNNDNAEDYINVSGIGRDKNEVEDE